MPDTKSPSHVRLQDPLSEVTRNERKVLLGISAIGIVIAHSGLVPSKISALGVDFDHADQTALLQMLSAIVMYFLVAFIIYASSDLVTWRFLFHDSIREAIEAERRTFESRETTGRPDDKYLETAIRRRRVWSRAGRPMSVIRALFEFGVPLMVGAYATLVLWTFTPRPIEPMQPSTVGSSQSQNPTIGPEPKKPLPAAPTVPAPR